VVVGGVDELRDAVALSLRRVVQQRAGPRRRPRSAARTHLVGARGVGLPHDVRPFSEEGAPLEE
jgi:hypothetical protein